MKLPKVAVKILFALVQRKLTTAPNKIIGGVSDPYMFRWYLLPRNPLLNVYLHKFWRSDDDRALHDHPWANASVLINGFYLEHTIAAGGIHSHTLAKAGQVTVRPSGKLAHRIELIYNKPCVTIFITGPRYREWGFHCKDGWIHWKRFTDPRDPGQIGNGCDQ